MEGERKMGNAEDGAEPVALDGKQMRMDALAESVFEVYVETIRGTGLDITPTAPAAVDERILGRVQSVLGSTFLTFFGITPRERYADVFEQISDFASRFAKDHIFPDGNKRTAVKMALAILAMHGWNVRADDAEEPERNELYQWVQSIVTGRCDAGSSPPSCAGTRCVWKIRESAPCRICTRSCRVTRRT